MKIKKSRLFEGVTRYRFGRPFVTGAVVYDDGACDRLGADALPGGALKSGSDSDKSGRGLETSASGDIEYFKTSRENGKTIFKYSFSDGDALFGLGQVLGSLNRRGRKYKLYATDDPHHTPEKESLYGSLPFAVVEGARTFGFFIDYPSEINIDAGFTDKNVLKISIGSENFDLYIFDLRDMRQIVNNYLRLTGAPYVPPKWALGYQQCRWSYPDRKSVEEIADNFEKHDILCDAIYLDIDYMKEYKVFTVDETKFPDFEGMVSRLKKRGIKIIAIIDPGVKIEKDYDVYEDGVKNDYFCRDAKGDFFTAAVWPGSTHFPDFLNPDSRRWWGGLYRRLTDLGVEGFWNDMNEPAIFYTPETLAKISKKLTDDMRNAFPHEPGEEQTSGARPDANASPDVGARAMPGVEILAIRERLNKLANSRDDYRGFYHNGENGEKILHDDVHNLYGFNMSLAAADGLKKINPGRRHFLLSRSSYAGMHRFAAIWMGDNMSWWEHLGVHIRMLISLNFCGFFYTGADVGGFGCDVSADLLIRWMQLGAFTPLFRNHSAMGTRRQEPWAFDAQTTAILRDVVRLRYSFIPYIYSEFMRCVSELTPFISALPLFFNDPIAREIEDQFMIGRHIMAAPVHAQNASGRHVYLPECRWLFWPASRFESRRVNVMAPGSHYVRAAINEIPLFIAENSMIMLETPGRNNSKNAPRNFIVVAFVTETASFVYYDDDGETTDYEAGICTKLNIAIEKAAGGYNITVSPIVANRPLAIGVIEFEIYDETGSLFEAKISSADISF